MAREWELCKWRRRAPKNTADARSTLNRAEMRELRPDVPSRTSSLLLFSLGYFSLFSFFLFLIKCRHGSSTTFPPLQSGFLSTVIPPLPSPASQSCAPWGCQSPSVCLPSPSPSSWRGWRGCGTEVCGGLTAARNPVALRAVRCTVRFGRRLQSAQFSEHNSDECPSYSHLSLNQTRRFHVN